MLKRTTGALVLAASVSGAQAAACAYDMTIGAFDVAYPGSVDVAVAVAQARTTGQLPQIDISQSALGFMIASRQMEALGREFSEVFAQDDTSFSLVLAGSRLWTAFDGTSGALQTTVHAARPTEDQPVIVTDFLVVDAILRGALTIDTARKAGLFIIRNDIDGRVGNLVEKAFESV